MGIYGTSINTTCLSWPRLEAGEARADCRRVVTRVRGAGLGFSTEICGSERDKMVVHEILQEYCVVLTLAESNSQQARAD